MVLETSEFCVFFFQLAFFPSGSAWSPFRLSVLRSKLRSRKGSNVLLSLPHCMQVTSDWMTPAKVRWTAHGQSSPMVISS